jgi:U2 small nuclear ribonucleoprotein B''
MAEPAPRETIYVNNINEKVSKDELKKSLYAAFSQFGPILDVIALKTFKMRGQAFIVFRDITAATQAVRQMQGFPFYEKPMMISYANSKSDAVAKLDGSYEAKDKAERASKRKAEREERKEAKKAGLAKPKEVAEAGVATPAAGEAVAQHVESAVLGGGGGGGKPRGGGAGPPGGGGGGGGAGRTRAPVAQARGFHCSWRVGR